MMTRTSKRECPPELNARLQLLNEIPRTDAEAKAFISRYAEATKIAYQYLDKCGPKPLNNSTNYTPRIEKNIDTQWQNFDQIFSDFRKKFTDYPLTVRHLGMMENDFVAEMELTRLRHERDEMLGALNLLAGRPYLDRLMMCPECGAIKWIKKAGTTFTCGQAKCVNSFADIKRGKKKEKK